MQPSTPSSSTTADYPSLSRAPSPPPAPPSATPSAPSSPPPVFEWKPFFFEGNNFFSTIRAVSDWDLLRAAYPRLTDDQLLAAHEATYKGWRSQAERNANPNYGFRSQHDGTRTLRDFFIANNMPLPPFSP